MPFPPITSSQIVCVNKGGSDSNAGTPDAPFLTIPAAIAAITDQTESKPYILEVGPGHFADGFDLPAHVYVMGDQGTALGGVIQMHPDGTSHIYTGIVNCKLFGNVFIDDCTHRQIQFINCWFRNMNLRVLGTTVAEPIRVLNCFGNPARAQAGQFNFIGFIGDLFIGETGSGITVPGHTKITGGSIGTLDIQQNNAGAANIVRTFGAVIGAVSIADAGDTEFQHDSVVDPADITIAAGAPLITLRSLSEAVNYVPAVLGDWSGTSPGDVKTALDRVAAAITPIP